MVFKFEWRAIYFGSLKHKLILAQFNMPIEFDLNEPI